MNDMIIYKESSKSNLIAAYKQYLRDNINAKIKKENKKNNGKKQLVTKYTQLKRPEIDGKSISWTKFKKQPKSLIVVHIFMEGCDPAYVSSFVMEKKPALSEIKGAVFCYHAKSKDSVKGFHWCNPNCCESLEKRKHTRYLTKGVKVNDASI
jgi:hypothetical protein